MTNKNYLVTKAYIDMAKEISGVLTDLRLIQSAIEFIPDPQSIKNENIRLVEHVKLYRYTDELFTKVIDIEKTLDDIGATLYSVDELDELKELVSEEYLIIDEPKDDTKETDLNEHIMSDDFSF